MDRAEREPDQALRLHEPITGSGDAPLALCSAEGELLSASPSATLLMRRIGVQQSLPTPLPPAPWALLRDAQLGQPVILSAVPSGIAELECIRYRAPRGEFLLWLRELPSGARTANDDLPLQRQAATGRLMASVAHDVRSSVASIVYSADFLEARGAALKEETLRDTLRDICDASRRLQLTVDGLLDYARLGPAISVPVSLHEVLNRAQSLLRSFYRDGAHRLRVELPRGADWVRGNPVVIEQIFVNLLLLSAESADLPSCVTVLADLHELSSSGLLQLRVMTDRALASVGSASGPGAAAVQSHATRMALLDARSAAESQGGRLLIEEGEQSCSFIVQLLRSEGPR